MQSVYSNPGPHNGGAIQNCVPARHLPWGRKQRRYGREAGRRGRGSVAAWRLCVPADSEKRGKAMQTAHLRFKRTVPHRRASALRLESIEVTPEIG
jgi:hypothetical protein